MGKLSGPFAWMALVLALVSWTTAARADGPAADDSASPPAGDPSAKEAPLHLSWKSGPQTLSLGHDVSLALPDGDGFVDGAGAAKLLERNGGFHNENVVGLVVGKSEDAKWFVVIRYDDEGYIKDTESIDADELLKSLKEGTEEANEERKKRGFAPFHVQGWSEPPRYDHSVHHLVWGLTVHGDDGDSVNYNTRVLGRRGVVSLNLVCDPADLANDRPQVATLLAGTSFTSGQRYEDFNAKTDKVAEYGLAGLVLGGVGLGVAAKILKIGLIAKFWNVILAALIAGKKAVILFFAGIAAYAKRLFGRKKPAAAAAPTPPPQASE